MIEPLEVFALNARMERMTGSLPYRSLQWRRRMTEPGSFYLEIPRSLYSKDWAYIYCDARPETGIIEKVEYDDDAVTEEGEDTIILQGRFLEALLDDYTFLVESPETVQRQFRPPPSLIDKRRPNTSPAYISTGGYIYTYNDAGELEGHAPAGADGASETKPLAGTMDNADGTVTVTDLSGAVYTVEPIDYQTWENCFNYITAAPNRSYLTDYREYWDGTSSSMVHDTFYTDGTGGVWYESRGVLEDGSYGDVWVRSTGVTQSIEDTYWGKRRAWRREKDALGAYFDGRNWVYDVKVKGPWQRTEADAIGMEMDNVQQLLIWVRTFFQDSILYEEPDFEGEVKVLNPSLKSLGEMLRSELATIGAAYSLEYSFAEDTCLFRIWRGADRTQAQDRNPWAVFSASRGTTHGCSAYIDTSNYKNTCYVLYDCEVPVLDQNGRPVLVADVEWDEAGVLATQTGWKLKTEQMRGYETVRLDDDGRDRECYLDLRGTEFDGIEGWKTSWTLEEGKPTFDDDAIARMTAATDFKARGIQHLATEHPIELSVTAGTLEADAYLIDYDIGDKVDLAIETIGLVQEARITGVDEVYEAGDPQIALIFGETETKIRTEVDDG